jgi:hypothetical protein
MALKERGSILAWTREIGHSEEAVLSVSRPVLGRRVQVTVRTTRTGSAGTLFCHAGRGQVPVAVADHPEWAVYLPEGNGSPVLAHFTTDAGGIWTFDWPLFDHSTFAGQIYCLQAVITAPAIAVTNAVEVHLGW